MFEKFAETLTSAGKVASEKAKIGTDYAKLNVKIASEEKAVADLYQKAGKLYYKLYKDNTSDSDSCLVFAEITEKLDKVKSLKDQLAALKGTVECPVCGKECTVDDDFCGKCGAKLAKQEPEEAKTDAVEEAEEAEIKVEVVDDEEDADSDDNV